MGGSASYSSKHRRLELLIVSPAGISRVGVQPPLSLRGINIAALGRCARALTAEQPGEPMPQPHDPSPCDGGEADCAPIMHLHATEDQMVRERVPQPSHLEPRHDAPKLAE